MKSTITIKPISAHAAASQTRAQILRMITRMITGLPPLSNCRFTLIELRDKIRAMPVRYKARKGGM